MDRLQDRVGEIGPARLLQPLGGANEGDHVLGSGRDENGDSIRLEGEVEIVLVEAEEKVGPGPGSPAVTRAASMDEAVLVAAEAARPGDAVLLSPGCASFDWYGGYGERGDDFARAVAEHAGRTS